MGGGNKRQKKKNYKRDNPVNTVRRETLKQGKDRRTFERRKERLEKERKKAEKSRERQEYLEALKEIALRDADAKQVAADIVKQKRLADFKAKMKSNLASNISSEQEVKAQSRSIRKHREKLLKERLFKAKQLNVGYKKEGKVVEKATPEESTPTASQMPNNRTWDERLSRARYTWGGLKILAILVLILIIIVAGPGCVSSMWNSVTTIAGGVGGGGVAGTIGQKAGVAYEDTGVSKEATSLWKVVRHPIQTTQDYFSGLWRPKVVEEKKRNVGVVINKFIPGAVVYGFGEDLYAEADVTVYGLEETDIKGGSSTTTTVEFRCKIGDEDSIPSISHPNPVKVFPGSENFYIVRCKFPPLKASDYVDKNLVTETVEIEALYNNFVSSSILSVYTMNKAKLNEKRRSGEDIFEGVIDKFLDKKRRITRSNPDNLPIIINLGIRSTQPLTSELNYQLSAPLSDNIDWDGRLKRIRQLKLKLPKNFEGKVDCNKYFDKNGNTYLFKTLYMKSLNNALAQGKELDEIRQYSNCDFGINGELGDLTSYFVESELIYDYSFSRKTTLDISKKIT